MIAFLFPSNKKKEKQGTKMKDDKSSNQRPRNSRETREHMTKMVQYAYDCIQANPNSEQAKRYRHLLQKYGYVGKLGK